MLFGVKRSDTFILNIYVPSMKLLTTSDSDVKTLILSALSGHFDW